MKKKLFLLLMSIFALIFCIPSKVVVANADTGPKPDFQIEIYNLDKSDYIVAYGIDRDNYGPHRCFVPDDSSDNKLNETYYGNADDLTIIYNNVTLPEGWKLCDISSFYSNTSELLITSGYYWPSKFILIIYDKTSSNYYLSEVTKTYAFHSYFKYDMNDYKKIPDSSEKRIILEKTYDYTKEILGFLLRLFITLAIEISLALLFKFNKKSLVIIGMTNAATQIFLNLYLNITTHFDGKSPWNIFIYVFIEALIVVIEAIIFKIFCRRGKEEDRNWIISYTVLANVLSFGLGMILWFII